jgi:hypothetical protein
VFYRPNHLSGALTHPDFLKWLSRYLVKQHTCLSGPRMSFLCEPHEIYKVLLPKCVASPAQYVPRYSVRTGPGSALEGEFAGTAYCPLGRHLNWRINAKEASGVGRCHVGGLGIRYKGPAGQLHDILYPPFPSMPVNSLHSIP